MLFYRMGETYPFVGVSFCLICLSFIYPNSALRLTFGVYSIATLKLYGSDVFSNT